MERTKGRQYDQEYRGPQHLEEAALAAIAHCMDGRDHRRHAEHHQDIGDVAAHHVADRDVRHAREGRVDADEQFRRRGAECDHGEPDNQHWNAQLQAQRHSAPHQEISGGQKKPEPGDHEDDIHECGIPDRDQEEDRSGDRPQMQGASPMT